MINMTDNECTTKEIMEAIAVLRRASAKVHSLLQCAYKYLECEGYPALSKKEQIQGSRDIYHELFATTEQLVSEIQDILPGYEWPGADCITLPDGRKHGYSMNYGLSFVDKSEDDDEYIWAQIGMDIDGCMQFAMDIADGWLDEMLSELDKQVPGYLKHLKSFGQ